MRVSLESVIFLNLLVNLLLLLAAGRLCGHSVGLVRGLSAAALGGFHAAGCLVPGFYFLGNTLWRAVSLSLMAFIAFGLSVSGFRRGLVFMFLSFALSGAVQWLGKGGAAGLLGSAGMICLLCGIGFGGRIGSTAYIPVELSYQDKRLRLTALRDTGNTLIDPITGRQVLIIGADAAKKLTGLTRDQLQKPVETIGALPGLRLIPYRSVGKEHGLLLALRLQDVKIGSWKGSSLVAFAPEGLSGEGGYQALTGG